VGASEGDDVVRSDSDGRAVRRLQAEERGDRRIMHMLIEHHASDHRSTEVVEREHTMASTQLDHKYKLGVGG
jgi:hypothetical protein